MLIQWWFLNCDKKCFRVFTCSFVFWSRHQNFHANKWPMLLDKCLAGLVFSVGLLCSLQRFPTFLSVSRIYSSPHEHLPLYITQEGCGFYLSCYPFYWNSLTLIGKCLKFLNKIFESIFVFFTIWFFNQYKWFTLFKKIS